MIVTLWRTFSRGRRSTYTWREFVDTFIADPEVVRDKRKVAGFSLASFEENRRALARVEQIYALTFDFDDGDTSVEQATRLLPGVCGVTHTTFSHSIGHPKTRAIFLLDKPVTTDEYDRLWMWAADKIHRAGHVPDEAACDASRFWYLPSHRPGAPYEWREIEGAPLDVDAALKEAHTPPSFSGPSAPSKVPRKPKERPPQEKDGGDWDASSTFYGRAFIAADMAFRVLPNDALAVVCPWSASHTTGVDGDESTVILLPTSDAELGLFHCSHAHCVRRKTSDLLDVLPVDALRHALREHGGGVVRAKVIDGWMQRLCDLPGTPALERYILKCRARDGSIFTFDVQLRSVMHRYLEELSLKRLIGCRVDVSMRGRTVKGARIVSSSVDIGRSAVRSSASVTG